MRRRAPGTVAPAARRGDRSHSGSICTFRPDELWGTDATRFYTDQDGRCWNFGAIDHCVEDIVGWHVAKTGDRRAALEPERREFESIWAAPKITLGLGVRHDWAPQYTSHHFAAEPQLGIRPTPSYVGEPECNGNVERFLRTLKEECLYVHDFRNLEEAREVVGDFSEAYNRE